MKKIFTLMSVVGIMVTTSFAQESGFGVKLGVNLATIDGYNTQNFTMRTSLNIGIYYNSLISDKFGIQAELVYSGQGAKQDIEEISGYFQGVPIYSQVSRTFKYDYINIPILAKYYFNKSLNIVAGPQIGILISSKVDTDVMERDNKEFTNGTDFALGVGFGYELESGLGFSFRYNIGISNIYIEGSMKNTNNVIQIGANWQF